MLGTDWQLTRYIDFVYTGGFIIIPVMPCEVLLARMLFTPTVFEIKLFYDLSQFFGPPRPVIIVLPVFGI